MSHNCHSSLYYHSRFGHWVCILRGKMPLPAGVATGLILMGRVAARTTAFMVGPSKDWAVRRSKIWVRESGDARGRPQGFRSRLGMCLRRATFLAGRLLGPWFVGEGSRLGAVPLGRCRLVGRDAALLADGLRESAEPVAAELCRPICCRGIHPCGFVALLVAA